MEKVFPKPRIVSIRLPSVRLSTRADPAFESLQALSNQTALTRTLPRTRMTHFQSLTEAYNAASMRLGRELGLRGNEPGMFARLGSSTIFLHSVQKSHVSAYSSI